MKFPSKTVGLAFLIHTLLIASSYFLAGILPSRPPAGFIDQSLYPMAPALESLVKWDAHWYTHIANYGYDIKSIVFFPLLVLLIKLLSFFGLHTALAGLVLCNGFAFLSFWIMDVTFRMDFSPKQVRRALLAYALMPTSFFLNSIYTEPLFITFSLLCIYGARKKQWWLGGMAGAGAALTRNLGIFLFLFLLYEFFSDNSRRSRPFRTMIPLVLPPVALSAFMAYNAWAMGNPLAFIISQQSWGRHFDFPWHNIMENIPLTFSPSPYSQPGLALDTILVITSLIALLLFTVMARFNIPPSYLLLGWLWFLMPLCSTAPGAPLYSMSRFLLPLFPLYLFWGQVSGKAFYSWLLLSGSALILCAALFINWYWIG